LLATTIDHVHAAALPLVGLTAWQALVENLGVSAGQRVLILGAGGGLGHVAVQVAKSRGAYVIGTASVGKHDFVTGLGADEVIDYRAGDIADLVRDVDVAFDLVGGKGPEALRVLRPGGVFTTAVERMNAELRETVTAAGFWFSSVAVEPDRAGLESIAALVDGGRLRPHVSHVLPLREVVKAHQLLDEGHLTGKIVLTTG
jgi:NADPH:quinone reductase-like Zn-dependent oxidoreductase